MIQSFISSVLKHQHIAVFSHIRPDGDAIGSQIGFCLWLKQHGVHATAFNDDGIPPSLDFLTDSYPFDLPDGTIPEDIDAIVLLDGNHPDRFGICASAIFQTEKPIYIVDHHPEPLDIYADKHWDVTASSTAELVFRLYEQSGLEAMSQSAAIALYTGIVTDTGSFRFDSVSPGTHLAAAELIARGNFKPNVVHEKLYDQKTPEQLALIGEVLRSMQFFADGRIGVVTVTNEMFNRTNTEYTDTEGLVAIPLSVKGVEAAVIFIEHQGRIKLSFRSKTDLDVNRWARQFEGGGHAKAAGGWTNGPIEDAVQNVLETGVRALSGSSTS